MRYPFWIDPLEKHTSFRNLLLRTRYEITYTSLHVRIPYGQPHFVGLWAKTTQVVRLDSRVSPTTNIVRSIHHHKLLPNDFCEREDAFLLTTEYGYQLSAFSLVQRTQLLDSRYHIWSMNQAENKETWMRLFHFMSSASTPIIFPTWVYGLKHSPNARCRVIW